MNSTTQGGFIRNVLELLIEEYKNAEKVDFINWNLEEGEDDEIDDD